MPDYGFYCEMLLSQTERAWTEEELGTLARIIRRDRRLSEGDRTLAPAGARGARARGQVRARALPSVH